jgi:hypothetical protein
MYRGWKKEGIEKDNPGRRGIGERRREEEGAKRTRWIWRRAYG